MKFQIMSDLHLEFGRLDIPPVLGDVLILAGDINTMASVAWINQVADNYRETIYICGNHEYYSSSFRLPMDEVEEAIKKSLSSRVTFLQNESLDIGDRMIHGCTLWTSFEDNKRESKDRANLHMNDFRGLITKAGVDPIQFDPRNIFKADDAYDLHKESVEFLEKNVKEGDIVVTHHLPSFQCVSPRFAGSPINGAFASDLDYIIEEKKPALWVFGHTHDSVDIDIDNTRCVCNPRGYTPEALNPHFTESFVVEI